MAVQASREHLGISGAGAVPAWLTPTADLLFRFSGCSTNHNAMGSTPNMMDFLLQIQPMLAFIKISSFWKTKIGLCDHHAVCISVHRRYQLLLAELVFMKFGMYIMVHRPIQRTYSKKPHHQSICLCMYLPIVAKQRLCKNVTMHYVVQKQNLLNCIAMRLNMEQFFVTESFLLKPLSLVVLPQPEEC
jgi:hypothetical protein